MNSMVKSIVRDVLEIAKICKHLALGLGHHPIWSNYQVLELVNEIDRLSKHPNLVVITVTSVDVFQKLKKVSMTFIDHPDEYRILVMTERVTDKSLLQEIRSDVDIVLVCLSKELQP